MEKGPTGYSGNTGKEGLGAEIAIERSEADLTSGSKRELLEIADSLRLSEDLKKNGIWGSNSEKKGDSSRRGSPVVQGQGSQGRAWRGRRFTSFSNRSLSGST